MVNGKQEGPYSAQEIQNRKFDPSTYVLLVGTSSWKKLSETREIFDNEPQKPIQPEPQMPEPDHGPKNKKEMFTNPFSFIGRIRRTEFGLTYIISFVCSFLIGLIIGIGGESASIVVIAYIPLFWFGLAQGAKRCHDRNNSGWFQLIPFYGLWMLFAEGDSGSNDYGESPK